MLNRISLCMTSFHYVDQIGQQKVRQCWLQSRMFTVRLSKNVCLFVSRDQKYLNKSLHDKSCFSRFKYIHWQLLHYCSLLADTTNSVIFRIIPIIFITNPVSSNTLKVDFFCAVKTSVLKFCARKSAKISLKIT